MDSHELQAELAASREAVEATAALLRFTFARTRSRTWAPDPPSEQWAEGAAGRYDGWLLDDEFHGDGKPAWERLSRAAVTELQQTMARCPARCEPGLAASELARVLDGYYGKWFAQHFASRGELPLEQGTVFPVEYAPLEVLIRSDLSSAPWSRPGPEYWTRHLRVWPDDPLPFRVVLDFSCARYLEALAGDPFRAATLHPNDGFVQAYGTYVPGARVYPVVPLHMDAQRKVLERLVDVAVEGEARILVLPELCVDEQAAGDLAERALRGGVRVVIGGSYHVTRGGRKVNECRLLLGSGTAPDRSVTHWKFRRLEDPVIEDIDPADPVIRCLSGGGWQLAMCICRDLLDDRTSDALKLLGCNLLLVPAMSPKLDTFRANIEPLDRNQAIVVIANNPWMWPGRHGGQTVAERAAFRVPTRGHLQMLTTVNGRPGVAWHDVNRGLSNFESL